MKPTIALFVRHPECSTESCNGIIQALGSHYNFKIFSNDYLYDNFFDDVSIIAFPGGIGDADRFNRLFQKNITQIRQFYYRGGAYLGICMGAYWAGKHYFDLLQDADAVQYISQPNTDTHRPHPKAISITWNGQQDRMYFYDGCAIVGNNFKTIATYANGNAMAVIQNRIGLIGCHPESTPEWYDKNYLKPHWHGYRHHGLLLDFTNELIKNR